MEEKKNVFNRHHSESFSQLFFSRAASQVGAFVLSPATLPYSLRTLLLVGGGASVPVFVPFSITMSRAINPNNLSIQTQEALFFFF